MLHPIEDWLEGQYQRLVNDLGAVLDLETGLREVTLSADHGDLVTDIAELLDLDVGLAAIGRGASARRSAEAGGPRLDAPPGRTGIGEIIGAILRTPPARRLVMRSAALDVARRLDGALDASTYIAAVRRLYDELAAKVHALPSWFRLYAHDSAVKDVPLFVSELRERAITGPTVHAVR